MPWGFYFWRSGCYGWIDVPRRYNRRIFSNPAGHKRQTFRITDAKFRQETDCQAETHADPVAGGQWPDPGLPVELAVGK